MKKLQSIITMALIAMTLFSGCKKDKDEPEANYFKVGNDSYEISANINYVYEGIKSASGIEMNFVGPGIDLSLDGDGIPKWDGTDIAVYFNIFTNTAGIIDAGTYEYADTYESFTFEYGDYCLQYTDGVSNTYVLITEGTITVTVDNGIYDFSLTGKDETGADVKMHYSGEFTYYTPVIAK